MSGSKSIVLIEIWTPRKKTNSGSANRLTKFVNEWVISVQKYVYVEYLLWYCRFWLKVHLDIVF